MNIIAWVVLGLIAGAISKLIYPGTQRGYRSTALLFKRQGSECKK
jgi:uncharacterized membrane protein YeaQ/YmgE (transglycosylase-associated protein family)